MVCFSESIQNIKIQVDLRFSVIWKYNKLIWNLIGVYHDLEGYLIENQELTNHSLTGLYATWPQGDFTISAVSKKSV